MDRSDVYPDVLGDALSYSSQRLAQLGSLVTAAAAMEVRRRAQASAADAARSQQELRALQDQQRAAWAPAHDARWLAQADLLQAARAWVAAAAYAGADPAAASAARKCEERLRDLHPYAMARYDRLRSEGAGAVEAMRQAVPLFGRAPHARPGDRAAERRGLEAPAGLVSGVPSPPDDVLRSELLAAASQDKLNADTADAYAFSDRTPAHLAAESFPGTAADAIIAAVSSRTQTGGPATRTTTPRPAKIGEVGDCADQVDLRLAARLDAFCSAVRAKKSSACYGGLDGRVARVTTSPGLVEPLTSLLD